jgi:hypothetical protein
MITSDLDQYRRTEVLKSHRTASEEFILRSHGSQCVKIASCLAL